jgi:uncharacterized protein YjiK
MKALCSIAPRMLATLLALCACSPPSAPAQAEPAGASLFAAAPDLQWRLPDRLREISGLAVTADGRVFGHDDESAIIYEIDVAQGRLAKAFALGDPVETGDFEGMAITANGDFWIVTSRGRLFRFREGADGAHVAYDRFDTELDDVCEIEGLAYLAAEESLILACKRNHARSMRDTVSLHIWPIGAAAATPWLSLPEAEIARAAGVRSFQPSAVEIDPATGRVVLVSANDGAFAELSAEGGFVAARALPQSHQQPEGVSILPDGSLVIADEAGNARPLISRYPRVQ